MKIPKKTLKIISMILAIWVGLAIILTLEENVINYFTKRKKITSNRNRKIKKTSSASSRISTGSPWQSSALYMSGVPEDKVLSKDTVWKGKVVIEGDVLVAKGTKLTIMPGTQIKIKKRDDTMIGPVFIDPRNEITVRGTIIAKGTKKKPVVFKYEETGRGKRRKWAGIIFDAPETKSTLSYVEVHGADIGITVINSSPVIQNSVFKENNLAIVIQEGAKPVIRKNLIADGKEGILSWGKNTNPEITSNKITNMEERAIVSAFGANPKISENKIKKISGKYPVTKLQSPLDLSKYDIYRGDYSKFMNSIKPASSEKSIIKDIVYTSDMVWKGDIIVDGVVRVTPGATLTIKPGTRVAFKPLDKNKDGIGEREIVVLGKLVAKGTKEQPIIFTSASSNPAPGDWGAINVYVSDEDNVVSNALVEYGTRAIHTHFSNLTIKNVVTRFNNRGIFFQESKVKVLGNKIVQNRGGVLFRYSTVTFEDNEVVGNRIGLSFLRATVNARNNLIAGNGMIGFDSRESKGELSFNRVIGNRRGGALRESSHKISNNQFSDNFFEGFIADVSETTLQNNTISNNGGYGVSVKNSKVTLNKNNIYTNLKFAVNIEGREEVSAPDNWWGTTNEKEISSLIYDGYDEEGLFKVNFKPFAWKKW